MYLLNVPSLCTKQTTQNGLKGGTNIISVIKCDVKSSGSISTRVKGVILVLKHPDFSFGTKWFFAFLHFQ